MSGAFLCALFLVLAGIFLRCALWLGYGNAGIDLRRLRDLSDSNKSLQELLDRKSESYATLSVKHDKLEVDYQRLTSQCKILSDANHELQGGPSSTDGQADQQADLLQQQRDRIEALELEISDIMGQQRKAAEHARQERDRADSLEAKLGELIDEQQFAAEALKLEGDRVESLQAAHHKKDAKLADLESDNGALADEAASAQHRIGELDQTIDRHLDTIRALQRENQELQRGAEQGDAERQKLESSLVTARERDASLESQIAKLQDEFLASLSLERNNLAQSAARFDEVQRQVITVSEQRDELAGLLEQANAELHLKQEAYENSAAEHQSVLQHRDGLASELNETRQQLAELQSQHVVAQQRQQELTEERDAITSALRRAELEIADVQSRTDAYEKTVANLRTELDQVNDRTERQVQQQILQIERDHDDAISQVQRERKDLLIQLERQKERQTVLEASLEEHLDTIQKLQEDSASLDALLKQQSAIQSSLTENAQRLHRATVDSEESTVDLEASWETNRRAAISMDQDGQRREPTIAASARVIDPQLGVIFREPPLVADDLKRISGIGETLEIKLNDLGVYTYDQVMQWDQTAIGQFSQLLGFRDRIDRDHWVAQARRLHSEAEQNQRAA